MAHKYVSRHRLLPQLTVDWLWSPRFLLRPATQQGGEVSHGLLFFAKSRGDALSRITQQAATSKGEDLR